MHDDEICHEGDNWLKIQIDKKNLTKKMESMETQPINELPIAHPVFYSSEELVQDLKKSYERCKEMVKKNGWDESQVGWYFFLAFDEFFRRYDNCRDDESGYGS